MGLAEITAFFKALPLLVEELSNLRKSVDKIRNDRTDMELALIKDRLNGLTSRLRTENDKAELAAILRDLNRL